MNNGRVSSDTIHQHNIGSINRNIVHGSDGISVKYLWYGMCNQVCMVLADLYSAIFSWCIICDVMLL